MAADQIKGSLSSSFSSFPPTPLEEEEDKEWTFSLVRERENSVPNSKFDIDY